MTEQIHDETKACQGCGASINDAAKYCPFCGAGAIAAATSAPVVIQDKCPNCGETRVGKFCAYCGYQFYAEIEISIPATPPAEKLAESKVSTSGALARTRQVDRVTAGVLAILLGTVGAHKFYMGKRGAGIACIIFCWTLIPTVIGIIEGIVYLRMADEKFRAECLK